MLILQQLAGMWHSQESLSCSPPHMVFNDEPFDSEESNKTKV